MPALYGGAGARPSQEACGESPVLDSPERVADVLREPNRLYTVESLQVLWLNTRRRLIAVENVAQELLDQVLVNAREVFTIAIAKLANRAHSWREKQWGQSHGEAMGSVP
jgi:DNA repair protein RadC